VYYYVVNTKINFTWIRGYYAKYFEFDALPRYAASVVGTVIFFLLLSILDRGTFVELQVYMGVGSFVLWLSDLGLVNRSMLSFASGRKGLSKYLLSLRILSFLFFGSIIGIITSKISDTFCILLFFGVMMDLMTDGFALFRTVVSHSNFPNLFLFFKKSFTLILIIFSIALHHTITDDELGIFLITSSFSIIVTDIIFWRKVKIEIDHDDYLKSILSWIQSGGVTLVGLDAMILSKAYPEIVAIFSYIRKVSNLLGVNAGRMTRKVLILDLDKMNSFIYRNIIIILPFQCFVFCSTLALNNVFLHFHLNMIGISTLLILILLLPIGFNTSLINLRFQKMGLYRELIYINWGTSGIYLVAILIGVQHKNPVYFLIGAMLNQILEILLFMCILNKFKVQLS